MNFTLFNSEKRYKTSKKTDFVRKTPKQNTQLGTEPKPDLTLTNKSWLLLISKKMGSCLGKRYCNHMHKFSY